MPDEIHPSANSEVSTGSTPDTASIASDKELTSTGKQTELAVTAYAVRADIDANTTAINEINARAEMGMRNRALTLSSVLTIILLTAHIYFAYIGRLLIFPDLMNEILLSAILAPWLGFGLGKAVLMITDKFGTK